jgi:phosphatidylinositol-bisphosphatase
MLSLFRDLLRSADEAKVILEAALVTTSENLEEPQNRRILAVVSHKDDWDLTEEGRYACSQAF